jgi:hypothetical protein
LEREDSEMSRWLHLLHLIQQPLCLVPRHAVGETDCSIS